MSESDQRACLNCTTILSEQGQYCPNCGQKVRRQRSTIGELLSDAFSSITNLDSTLWQTVKIIWRPGKLTQEYFAGRRKNFITPIRLFLVAAIFFFAAFNTYFGAFLTIQISSDKDLGTLFNEVIYHKIYAEKLDSIVTVEKKRWNSTSVNAVLDSTINQFNLLTEQDSIDFAGNVVSNVVIENSEGDSVKLVLEDLTKSPDAFIVDNKIEGFWKETLIRQSMRFIKSPDSLIQFLVGQLTWMFLLLMPAIALVLKLMYWRRSRYFIEHLVFTIHWQSFGFLFLAFLFVVVPKQLEWMSTALLFVFSICFLYTFIAFYQYYKQSWTKTLIKSTTYLFTYVILFSFFLIGAVLISALLF